MGIDDGNRRRGADGFQTLTEVQHRTASGDGETQQASDPDLEFRPYDRFWEDFAVGMHLRSRGMTITETHIVNWANAAGDWLPLHVDHHTAAQSPFGSVIAHGPLTLSLALGLVIQTGFFGDSVIAWLGLDDVRLPRPALPGDTIYVNARVAEHLPTSRPERGRLRLDYEVVNQRDEVVMTFSSGFLVRRSETGPTAG